MNERSAKERKKKRKKVRKKDREQERKTESKNNEMDEVHQKIIEKKNILNHSNSRNEVRWNGMKSDQALLLFLVPPLLLYSDLAKTRHNNHIK